MGLYQTSSISKKSTICHRHKKFRFWSSLCWMKGLSRSFLCAHPPQEFKETHNLLSNKPHISHEHVISKKKKLFLLYIRGANACTAVLLALHLGKASQVGFKDWLHYQWGYKACSSPCPLFSFFSRPNQWRINKLLLKKREESILNNIAAGTGLRGNAEYCVTHDTHTQQSWHSYDKFTPKNVSVSVSGQCPKCLV